MRRVWARRGSMAAVAMTALAACLSESGRSAPADSVAPSASTAPAKDALAPLFASAFGTAYRLAPGDRWALRDGGVNNTVATPTLPHTILEFTTVEGEVTGAGVTFVGTTSLDSAQRTFLRDLLHWLDPQAGDEVERRVAANTALRFEQVSEAPAIHTTALTVRAASVGGDAVVSVRKK